MAAGRVPQQWAALIIATYGGALLTHFGQLMSAQLCTLGSWSLPITIVCIVGVMNAINMSDGLDGLAGSLVLAACLGFGYVAGAGGDARMFTTFVDGPAPLPLRAEGRGSVISLSSIGRD